MTAKTFRAPSTQAAFDLIQQELGPEAIIVSVRQIPGGPAWQTWKRPEVEVLALPGNGAPAPAIEIEPVETRPASQPVSPLPHQARPAAQTAQALRQAQQPSRAEIEALLLSLATRAAPRETTPPSTEEPKRRPAQPAEPERLPQARAAAQPAAKKTISRAAETVRKQLKTQGVEEDLLGRMLENCELTLSPSALEDESRVRAHVRSQMEAFIRIQRLETLHGPVAPANRVICLVGPSGSGKTGACAKLAAFARRTLNKKVAWVSADTVRAGAISLARTYTETVGIPLRLAYTPTELSEMVQKELDADLVLVDMPACNPYSQNELIELGALLTAIPERTTLLAAPATSQENDLQAMTAAFGAYSLKGLVLTKLDETRFYGGLFNTAWRTQLPLVMMTSGSRLLGDLQMAQTKTFTGLLFGERPARNGG